MESIHSNATEYTRVRKWQDALATDGANTAEAIVLGYVLDGWRTDLSYRLEFESSYSSSLDRYGKLKETLGYINWMLDRLAKDIPAGQDIVQERNRVLFELIRDASLDLSIRVLGIERQIEEQN